MLPQLCHVTDEEWITVDTFKEVSNIWRDNPPLQLYCESEDLMKAVQEMGKVPPEESGLETRSIAHQVGSKDHPSYAELNAPLAH